MQTLGSLFERISTFSLVVITYLHGGVSLKGNAVFLF